MIAADDVSDREWPEIVEPERRGIPTGNRLLVAYALAVVLPALTGLALVPFRDGHQAATALLMILPVVLVAAIGTTRPGVVAALSAAVSFDVLLTEPYLHPAISSADDITAAITLAVVGLTIGVLSGRLAGLARRDAARREELHHLIGFIDSARRAHTLEEVTSAAEPRLAALLGLDSCHWDASPQDDPTVPVLLPTGVVMGPLRAMNPNRAVLPEYVDLVVDDGPTQLGRFTLRTTTAHSTSLEERLTAVTIASVVVTCAQRLH